MSRRLWLPRPGLLPASLTRNALFAQQRVIKRHRPDPRRPGASHPFCLVPRTPRPRAFHWPSRRPGWWPVMLRLAPLRTPSAAPLSVGRVRRPPPRRLIVTLVVTARKHLSSSPHASTPGHCAPGQCASTRACASARPRFRSSGRVYALPTDGHEFCFLRRGLRASERRARERCVLLLPR